MGSCTLTQHSHVWPRCQLALLGSLQTSVLFPSSPLGENKNGANICTLSLPHIHHSWIVLQPSAVLGVGAFPVVFCEVTTNRAVFCLRVAPSSSSLNLISFSPSASFSEELQRSVASCTKSYVLYLFLNFSPSFFFRVCVGADSKKSLANHFHASHDL